MIREATARRQRADDGQFAEYYRSLAERIRGLRTSDDAVVQVLGITSCQTGEGVSTVAVNLALAAAALHERPVLLVDANLSRPALDKMVHGDEGAGLADALLACCTPHEAIRPSSEPQLSIMTAGTTLARTRASYNPAQLGEMFAQLKTEYPLVLVDLPAATPTSMCWNMASVVDGLLLVIEAERSRRDDVDQAKRRLERAGGKILGVVLNKQRNWSWPQRYFRMT